MLRGATLGPRVRRSPQTGESFLALRQVADSCGRLPDRCDRGLELRDVVRLAEHCRARIAAQALVQMRTVVAGCDDDRKLRAQATQLQRQRVTASIREAYIDHRKGERHGAG